MSVEQQVRDAGTRLKELPVEVPAFEALVRHRQRRRSAAMSGAIVVLLVVVAASVLAVRDPAEPAPADLAPSARRPAADGPIGLSGAAGFWPADARSFSTTDELATAFASEVLGWPDAALGVGTTDPPSGTMVTVVSGDRQVDLRAELIDGGWRLVQIGDRIGLGSDGTSALLALRSPPAGTVEIRSWILVDGAERVTIHPDPSPFLVLGVPLNSVSSTIVVFLDEAGHALGARGGNFAEHNRAAIEPLATYGLPLSSAPLVSDEKHYPSVLDSVVWTDADRQTYLTLSTRPGVGFRAPEPAGFGPMTEDSSFPEGQGRAWFTSDAVGEPVRSMRMWWTRPDGALWLLSMHWPHAADGVAHSEALNQMRGWALKIGAGETFDGYSLAVVGSERLAMDEAGTIRHRARVWEHPAGEIVLSTWADSVATGLTNALHRESVPIVVDDTKGWLAVDPQGRESATVAWQRDDRWFTLSVPAALADSIEGIVASLQRE